jgi:hypothetical protein
MQRPEAPQGTFAAAARLRPMRSSPDKHGLSSIVLYLVFANAMLVAIFGLFYVLMQPRVLANPGMAAYKAPPAVAAVYFPTGKEMDAEADRNRKLMADLKSEKEPSTASARAEAAPAKPKPARKAVAAATPAEPRGWERRDGWTNNGWGQQPRVDYRAYAPEQRRPREPWRYAAEPYRGYQSWF